ncbi:hypothetical protein [Aquirhabdus parva]|uniref:Uncharacterized protein n=1 Tax=Aquirhabdus parva TaxID=2283318 RepID=A0A345P6Z0_9GAMM|nr:hypothetical protein [Aquirhabdus parva]AXI03049.1 hypothetical protein HYN46_09490 [Aquirhabdus parva]
MNVHPQLSDRHDQQELVETALNNSLSLNTSHPTAFMRSADDHQIGTLTKLNARMHFTVSEDQALVMRRVLVNAAGTFLKDLRITPIKSKHIVQIALDLDSTIIDHVIRTVIRSMQSAEMGRIIQF